tara:strand:+ start:1283 stop:1828 length:546 start_codon:yes stop_codon:yes gene_type:complete
MNDEGNDVFSGSVNSQPQMVNVQPAGTMMYVEKSQLPQIIGILVMIYGGYGLLGSTSGLLGLAFPEAGAGIPTWIIVGQTITGLIISAATGYAGFLIFSYKKKGIWISLIAIACGWISSTIWTLLSSDYVEQNITSQEGGENLTWISDIMVGSSAICGFICTGICGIIVLMPLFFSNHGME